MRRLTALLAAACTLTAPLASRADSLTRDAAMTLAAERGPGVAVARAPEAAYRDALDESRALFIHSPRVMASAGQRFSPVLGNGLEANVTVLQDIPLRAVGARREDSARALLAGSKAEVAGARLDAAARAGLAWATAREAEELLALRRSATAEARELERLAGARVTTGTSMPSDAAIASGEVALATAAELDAEGTLTEAMNELRFSVGAAPNTDLDPDGSLDSPREPPLDEAGALRLALERSPSVSLASSRRALARSDAALALASQAPTLGIGASYTHEGVGDNVWTAIVSFPLPLSRPGAYDAARQMGAAFAADREIELVRADLARAVALAVHECHHTRETRDAFDRAIAPLQDAVRMARAQLVAGTSDATTLVFARQRLLVARERSLHATAEILRADVNLLRLAGTLLGGSS